MTSHGEETLSSSEQEDLDRGPDEDTTENVIELLRKYDQDLIRGHQIEPDDAEEYLFQNGISNPIDRERALLEADEARAEVERSELENFTNALRSTLNIVGLADPASVTPENVMGIDQGLLEQLDPYNAESLFFEVARKVHKRLGPYEHVTWRRLLEQAQHENQEVVDLDNLQLKQRIVAFGYLIELGIDPNEIKDMVKFSAEEGVAAPSRRQNVNRMAYFFEEEPLLEGLVTALKRKAKKRKRNMEQPIPTERAVRMGQIVLRLRSERLEAQRQKQTSLPFGNENQWDSIDHDVYKKMQRRIRTSLSISNLILAEMKINTVDDLIDNI
jgi:hypothetical protein